METWKVTNLDKLYLAFFYLDDLFVHPGLDQALKEEGFCSFLLAQQILILFVPEKSN